MKPSEVLSKAADLIEPEGAWVQEDWFGVRADPAAYQPSMADCWCAEGAICHVLGIDYSNDVTETEAEGYLVRYLKLDSPYGVPAWNDHPERTQVEVVKALRDASELAKAEGQ